MAQTTIVAEPGVPQIVTTTEYDAPPELIFRAYTDPDLLVQWLGPRRLTMKIDEHDPRDGGKWRFVHTDADGAEYGFHGVFHGTPSPEDGIVRTFEFEGAPGNVSLETATFERHGSRTVVRQNLVFQSVEARDGMMSGMQEGADDSTDRLATLVERLSEAA